MKYILLTWILLLAGSVSACSFSQEADIFKTAEENYSSYDQVLSVTIASQEETSFFPGQVYVFVVHETHKGPESETTLTLNASIDSCGFFYNPGTHMLIFLNEGQEFIDDSTPRERFDSKEEAIQAGRFLESPYDHIPLEVPDDCRIWFDGCTLCERFEIGGKLACNEFGCSNPEQVQPAQCREYFIDAINASADMDTSLHPVPASSDDNHVGPGAIDASTGTTSSIVPGPGVSPEESAPYVSGPTTDPLDNFEGPTSPPPQPEPGPEILDVEEKCSWWQKILDWIIGLFR